MFFCILRWKLKREELELKSFYLILNETIYYRIKILIEKKTNKYNLYFYFIFINKHI